MSSALPSTVHISSHPCARAKLSQLRSASTNAKETKRLVHEIATIVGVEALGSSLKAVATGTVSFPLPLSTGSLLTVICRFTMADRSA